MLMLMHFLGVIRLLDKLRSELGSIADLESVSAKLFKGITYYW